MGFGSSFIGCESFLESNPCDIMSHKLNWFKDSIDSNTFSVGVIFLKFVRATKLLICMVLHYVWRRDIFLHETFLEKTLRILINVFYWLYVIWCLTMSSYNDHQSFLCAWFLCYFIFYIQGSLSQYICYCNCLWRL